jgi:tetratricopeptide (TPR) repeat protein
MILFGRQLNRILKILSILMFIIAVLQPLQCADQDDLLSLINKFNGLSQNQQREAAMKIFSNYKEYKDLKPWELNPVAARAIDNQMVEMTKETWGEVSLKKGGIEYIVPVGTLGNRNDPKSKYTPGKSDKDFIPMGTGAGDAAGNFEKAFRKKFGLDPASLDINVLDPTKIETWPDRINAFSNPEKYNTLGGNKWLQGDLYKKDPNIWLADPLSEKIDEIKYRDVTPDPPPKLEEADAAGLYSDDLRFRDRYSDLDPETRMLKQSKYDLRNAEAYKTAGGKLTASEEQLVSAADKARNGLTKEAIEEYGKSMGLSGDAALQRYITDMDLFTERMGKKCLTPLLEKASMGTMSGVAKIELAGVLANLPESKAAKLGEELAQGTVNKQVWNEALVTASTLRSSSSTMVSIEKQFNSMALEVYGKNYNELTNAEKLAVHGAIEESSSFASKAFKAAGVGAAALFSGWAIYDAYKEGKKEGTSKGLEMATGRACLELIEMGVPILQVGDMVARLAAMGIQWKISAFKDDQLDKLYNKYKETGHLEDVLYNAEFSSSGSASALRQLAIEERQRNPNLSDAEVEANVRAYVKNYLERRLATEQAVSEYENLKARLDSWVYKNEIPLEPGSDSVTARIDNEHLSKDDYDLLMAELMKKYYHIQGRLMADRVPFTEKDILGALWEIYKGDPERLDNYMRNLYHNAGQDNLYNRKYAKNYLARVVKTNGGDPFINRGNISGRDPLGFLNCLCHYSCSQAGWNCGGGAYCHYDPNPRGDRPDLYSCDRPGTCICEGWGCGRADLINSVENYNTCATDYGITEMKTNKTPIQLSGAGTVLKDGDQLFAKGETVLAMPDGSRLLVDGGSILTFTDSSTGKVLVDVQQGKARFESAPTGASIVEVQLRDKKIQPKGTEYTVQWDGKAGNVAVIDGSLAIFNETQSNEILSNRTESEVSLAAGQQLELPAGKISPYNLSTDDGGLFVGLPLRELILDDSEPEPYGEYDAGFADGTIPEGWIWQDPKKDSKMETPENGTLKVTVPDGNELWGYPGVTLGQRTDAPRLLHKVTGDFDLEGQIFLKSNCTDYAGTQFVLYSPGSNLGLLANQMKPDGLGEDFRIMGGSWSKSSGLIKLDSFNKELKDCSDAPNTPVKVKLTRRGDVWKSYWSLDGDQWNLAGRQEFNASDTVWVGWVFRREAYDGLHSEPAITTLKDVRLMAASRDSMESQNWDLVQWAGTAFADNTSIRLALNGSTLGSVRAFNGGRVEGDFDAVVRFNTSNWTGQEGGRREFGLFAGNFDEKNLVYIGLSQQGTEARRYQSDLEIDGSWHRYKWIETSVHQGYLRIVRHSGNFSTYYLSECQWVPLAEFGTGFTDPVYVGIDIDNAEQATKPIPLAVDYNLEQIQAGEAASENWTPAYCSLIQPVPLPGGITLPQGVEAKMFKPDFALGTIFFGPDGMAYAFSSESGKQKLMAIDNTGTARTFAESEILAGINRKTGVFLGSNILMTVEGGNKYVGIFELDSSGTFSQWNLKSGHNIWEIISAPDGGWYFSDISNDNIYHLAKKDAAEEPMITRGDSSSRAGLEQLAYDNTDETLYALDNYLDWRGVGTFRVCKITSDGEVVEVAKINETSKMNGGMALSSSGPFGHALYVSDAAAGKVLKVTSDGTIKPVITGLIKPGEMQFNPVNGDLLIVCDDGKSLLWVGSDLSLVGTGSSAGMKTPVSNEIRILPQQPKAGPALDLSGDWIMQGKQTGVENSDFKAVLTLNSNGTSSWLQKEGANAGATRNGSWEFDGTAITMRWSSPKGGPITWISSSVTAEEISDGTYSAERVSGGTWSAVRSGQDQTKGVNLMINDTLTAEPLIQALEDNTSSVQEKAIEALEKINNTRAVEPLIQDNTAIYWLNKGNEFYQNGSYELAIKCYNKSLEINPEDTITWLWNGKALNELKRYNESIISYDKALDRDPLYAEAWYNKGKALQNLKRQNDALECYVSAIQLNNSYAEAWFGKADVLYNIKNYKDALEAYKKSIDLCPNSTDAWYGKGLALYNLSKYNQSVEAFNKTIVLNPEYAEAWYGKGIALQALNLNAEANEAFNKARELGLKWEVKESSNTTMQSSGSTTHIYGSSIPKVNNAPPAIEPDTRLITGYVKYKGGNAVRTGVNVKLQEIFNGNIFDIASAVSSRQDGSFKIIYNPDRLHNPDNPRLILQAFFGGEPFSDPMEYIGGTNEKVDLICSPHQSD